MSTLLAVEGLSVRHAQHRRSYPAVDAVSLTIASGESVGLIGESGAGKSTLAHAILQRVRTEQGSVRFAGRELARLTAGELRRLRPKIQLIGQQPAASLDPRFTALQSVAEAIVLRAPRQSRAAVHLEALGRLADVGLAETLSAHRPHQLSGGQCQRVAIARALASRPELLICDEITSGQDALNRLQIVRLLAAARADSGMSLLIISHELAILHQLTDRIVVMHEGRVIETSSTSQVLEAPRHPKTRALIAAVPTAIGVLPTPPDAPRAMPADTGCRFQSQCASAVAVCARAVPPLASVGTDRLVACWRAAPSAEAGASEETF